MYIYIYVYICIIIKYRYICIYIYLYTYILLFADQWQSNFRAAVPAEQQNQLHMGEVLERTGQWLLYGQVYTSCPCHQRQENKSRRQTVCHEGASQRRVSAGC